MDNLKKQIKRYERYKLYRIRPDENRRQHRIRIRKLH